MRFESPLWFLAAAVIALGILARFLFIQSGMWARPAVLFANLPPLLRRGTTWRVWARRGLGVVHVLALAALVTALARPQEGRRDSVVTNRGIDIMLVVDTSGSMAAEDFGEERTRLDHVIDVMRDFAKSRPGDRVGLVSFGAYAYTRCPMTLDHALLDSFFGQVLRDWNRAYESSARKSARTRYPNLTPQEEDLQHTAIGDAVVTGTARLEESSSKSRVMVLLTDGVNNYGDTDPLDASELAKELGIKLYCVGAGSNQLVRRTVIDAFGDKRKVVERVRLDEATLTKMAERTGGRYFPARSRRELESVYDEIDRLEKTDIKTRDFREWDERFQPLVLIALGLLLLEAILAATVLRSIP